MKFELCSLRTDAMNLTLIIEVHAYGDHAKEGLLVFHRLFCHKTITALQTFFAQLSNPAPSHPYAGSLNAISCEIPSLTILSSHHFTLILFTALLQFVMCIYVLFTACLHYFLIGLFVP